MLRGMYTATTAMMAQSRRMDTLSNNLTNVLTTGFKADTLTTESFRDMMISAVDRTNATAYQFVGPHSNGIHIDRVNISFQQGPLETTDINTDLALEGEGFFTVLATNADGSEETLYTRAGNFVVNMDGDLVTDKGNYVLDEFGNTINVGNDEFSVDQEGNITTSDGEELGRLGIVTFEDLSTLRKVGDNTLRNTDPDNNPEIEARPKVVQSMLEGSNVDVARETVDMMATFRAYEINQKIVKMYDESLGKAVNDIGRVSG